MVVALTYQPNLLDNKVEQFIGGSIVGRLVQGRFTYSF